MYQLEILESKLDEKEFEQISYGTIETWLVWRLTKEKLFVTDLSCVSACGFYDIYEVLFSYFFWQFLILKIRTSFSKTGVLS